MKAFTPPQSINQLYPDSRTYSFHIFNSRYFSKNSTGNPQHSCYGFDSDVGHHLLLWSPIKVCLCMCALTCASSCELARKCLSSGCRLFEQSCDESLDKHKGMSARAKVNRLRLNRAGDPSERCHALWHCTGLSLHHCFPLRTMLTNTFSDTA